MAKTIKLTATTPTGKLITRRTARTYTHAVLVEIELNDGTIYYTDASWCGRSDLAQKALAKSSDFAARLQGTEYRAWDEETRTWQDTGKFRARCTALALPVNA